MNYYKGKKWYSILRISEYCQNKPMAVLFIVFLLLAVTILTNAWFYPDGYTTPDSFNYLRLAKSLVEGEGFDTRLNLALDDNTQFFASWPVGYPLLIALLALIPGLGVFWASKIFSCIMGIGLLFMFYKWFGSSSWVYGFTLLGASFLEIFSHTWSEVPFLLGLCSFVFTFFEYYQSGKQKWLVLLCLSVLWLFLSRYVGGFVFFILGGFFIWKGIFEKKWDTRFILFTSLTLLVCLGYLLNNFWEVGYLTGTSRVANVNGFFPLFADLIEALLKEFAFPVTRKFSWLSIVLGFLVLQIVLGIVIYRLAHSHYKQFDDLKSGDKATVWPFFLLTGLVYLITIIIIRFTLAFDPFNFRLLAPGSLLLLMAGINWILQKGSHMVYGLGLYLGLFGLGSFLINAPIKHFYNKHYEAKTFLNYGQVNKKVEAKYDFIEEPTLVAFGSGHLLYKNLNGFVTEPGKSLDSPEKAEPMNEFLKRLRQFNGEVYLEIPDLPMEKSDAYHFHPSVKRFLNNHQGQRFIQVK